jgi:GDP-mannose 6-dehydrogenase
MGYVGCVSGACFAQMGHQVLGVEPNPVKINLINTGKSPIVETGLDALMTEVVQAGLFHATSDSARAIKETDLALICVGTPNRSNGSIDLQYVERVCEEIGQGLTQRSGPFTVAIRSTVVPGTMEDLVIPTIERSSGKKVGKDFGLCMHPEFLREGTSIHDFYYPPKTVIGQYDEASGDPLVKLYESVPGPIIRTSLRVAEMVKYADNCFHALKVTFANEIGGICKDADIDSHEVMNIFCQDTKLNLSPSYLKPGFAFGGSCLPKDLKALIYEAKARDVDVPMLNAVLESNTRQIQRLVDKLVTYKGRSIGFLGLSFKGGTDDLRSSPIVDVVESMIGKGFEIRIYDEHVSLARLMGANKEYIEKEIPHISKLMCASAEEIVDKSDVIVIAHKDEKLRQALDGIKAGRVVVDVARIGNRSQLNGSEYYGISW